jgi:hypothetical protein
MHATQLQKWCRWFSVLLLAAAAWNIVGAILVLLNLKTHITVFFGADAVFENRVAIINTIGFWGQVILFGAGYLIVAADPTRNHGILYLAISGKIAVCILWVWCWLQGYVTVVAFWGGIGDLVFAVLLLVFLAGTRRLLRSSVAAGTLNS